MGFSLFSPIALSPLLLREGHFPVALLYESDCAPDFARTTFSPLIREEDSFLKESFPSSKGPFLPRLRRAQELPYFLDSKALRFPFFWSDAALSPHRHFAQCRSAGSLRLSTSHRFNTFLFLWLGRDLLVHLGFFSPLLPGELRASRRGKIFLDGHWEQELPVSCVLTRLFRKKGAPPPATPWQRILFFSFDALRPFLR